MLQGWQITAAEMMFQGHTNDEIIATLWPNCKSISWKRKVLRDLLKDETFMEYYRSIITEWTVHSTGPAMKKLREQLDSEKEWLANKAANDIINQSKMVITGADDNTVLVKVEGMPALGSPEQDE